METLTQIDTSQPLTKDEICKIFRISGRTLGNWMRKGKIPYIKAGGTVRFIYSDVLEASRVDVIEKEDVERQTSADSFWS